LGLETINAESANFLGNSIHKTTKLSLILLGQFQIENCIQNINKAPDLNANSPGFYSRVETIINHLGINSNRIKILNVGALVRNRLHSNGIHSGYRISDFHLLMEGFKYDFIQYKKVTCASLPHIAHSLECSINVLDEIINNPRLKQIATRIEDKYISQIDLNDIEGKKLNAL